MNANLKIKSLISFIIISISFPLFAEEIVTANKIKPTQITPIESLLPMLLGLSAILFVIFILALLMKKVTGLNVISNNIKVIESQSLGAKEKLVIVEIQGQQHVLGVTAHSINQICQLQQNIEKKPPMIPFDRMMKQFLKPKSPVAQQKVDSAEINSREVN